jgi:catechol 2,3-dioxygenase-like lactoylglutathione lyase family enzyme
LKTNDLKATIDFYVKVLGFVCTAAWPAGEPASCTLKKEGVCFNFDTDPNKWYAAPCLSGQFWIDVEGVAELHASVADKVTVEWGPEVYHYGRREFAIKDCNGYLLTFSEPTSDPPTCD